MFQVIVSLLWLGRAKSNSADIYIMSENHLQCLESIICSYVDAFVLQDYNMIMLKDSSLKTKNIFTKVK